jgi:hypothetical protein
VGGPSLGDEAGILAIKPKPLLLQLSLKPSVAKDRASVKCQKNNSVLQLWGKKRRISEVDS